MYLLFFYPEISSCQNANESIEPSRFFIVFTYEWTDGLIMNGVVFYSCVQLILFRFYYIPGVLCQCRARKFQIVSSSERNIRRHLILWDIVNLQLGSGLGLGLGLGSGLGLGLGSGFDSVHGSTISHKMKYLPKHWLNSIDIP